MSRRRLGVWALALAMVTLTCGCEVGPRYTGECSGRIRFHHVVYRPDSALNQYAVRGRLLGTGDVIACGRVSPASVDRVKVFAVADVEVGVAVMTDDADWHGIYLAAGVPRSSLPHAAPAQR